VSSFDHYPHEITIAVDQLPDQDALTAPADLASSVTSPCRVVRKQRRHELKDGSFEMSMLDAYLPSGVTIPDGAVFTVNGQPHRLIDWREENDTFGTTEGMVLHLQ